MRLLWVGCCVLAACVGPLSTGCTEGRGDPSGATTGDGLIVCELPYNDFQCDMDISCAVNVINNCDPPAVPATGDPACVISRLRGSSPARVQIGTSEDQDAVFCGWLDDIHIIGDGTAIMRRTVPGSLQGFNVRRVAIREPEFFDQCAESEDPVVLHACLSDWFVTASCVEPVCCPVASEDGQLECVE